MISGNAGVGIDLAYAYGGGGDLIAGNFLGTDPTGTLHLGNSSGGVTVSNAGSTIGGDVASANVVAYNGGDGVVLLGPTAFADPILSNSIHDNAGLGIDLGGDGVTPNTPGAFPEGSNRLQNYPVLVAAVASGSSTTIYGTLNSTPNGTFTVQFFANGAADPLGYGEGETYLGQLTDVATDSDGDASFTFVAPGPLTGDALTATATDSPGDTSEFARDLAAGSAGDADLAVSPTSGATSMVTIGQGVNDVFTITDDGPDPAFDLVATGTLPGSLSGATVTASEGDVTTSAGGFTVSVPFLPPGGSFAVTVSGTAAAAGSFAVTVSATSAIADPNSVNDAATIITTVGRASTTTTLSARPNPSALGQAVTFTATVSGTSPTGVPGGSVVFSVDGREVATVPVVASADGLSASASFAISGSAPAAIRSPPPTAAMPISPPAPRRRSLRTWPRPRR